MWLNYNCDVCYEGKVHDVYTWGTRLHLQGQERPPQEGDQRMNRSTLDRKEGKYFREREQHVQTVPQSVHLSPDLPLAGPTSQVHSHVRDFAFSSPWFPFAWKSLPHDLCMVHYLFIQIPTIREAPQDSIRCRPMRSLLVILSSISFNLLV